MSKREKLVGGWVIVFSIILCGWGCSRDDQGFRPEAQVLSLKGSALHLGDHVGSAAILEIPYFESYSSIEESREAWAKLLSSGPYQPKTIHVFPNDQGDFELHNMTPGEDLGAFRVVPKGPDDGAYIELAVEGDLGELDILSIEIELERPGKVSLAWRTNEQLKFVSSNGFNFQINDGGLHRYHFLVRSRPLSQSENGAMSLIYGISGGGTNVTIPAMMDRWHGRLEALRLFPPNRRGSVSIKSVVLRSSKPASRLLQDRWHEFLLKMWADDALATYGKGPFVREFRMGRQVEEGLLTFAPSRVTFDIDVTADAYFDFGYGVPSRAQDLQGDSDVTVRVTASPVGSKGDRKELFHEKVAGTDTSEEESARRGRVDLQPYKGQRILLELSTGMEKLNAQDDMKLSGPAVVWFDPVVHPVAAPKKTNVILFSIDTLRPDHLGVYGHDRATSPNIDAFARQGTTFKNAYSTAPWTLPAHMSMMTGLYPRHHGVVDESDGKGAVYQLSPKVETLASVLAEYGYYTFALTDGGFVASNYGFSLGFRRYTDMKFGERPGQLLRDPSQLRRTINGFLKWVGENPDTAFFAFLHSYQVHAPYSAPEPFGGKYVDRDYSGRLDRTRFFPEQMSLIEETDVDGNRRIAPNEIQHLIDLYDGEIAYFDHNFGLLIEGLRDHGLLDRTLIIVTSDHGEEFGERGRAARHDHTLYNELLRVPLIFHWPDRIPAGKVIEDNVSLVDLFPTIAEACGLPVPDGLQGRSLIALIAGTRQPERVLYAGGIRHWRMSDRHPGREQAAIIGIRKAIDYGDYRSSLKELFDFGVDPGELNNLAENNDDSPEGLFDRIRAYRDQTPDYRARTAGSNWADSNEQHSERLRALGYVE